MPQNPTNLVWSGEICNFCNIWADYYVTKDSGCTIIILQKFKSNQSNSVHTSFKELDKHVFRETMQSTTLQTQLFEKRIPNLMRANTGPTEL